MDGFSINLKKNFENITDEELKKELEDFYEKKQKLRKLVEKQAKKEMLFNVTFLVVVLGFFILGAILKHIDATLSLEIAILLVSVKMVWMIYEQQKANHFFFWILSTLEHEVNQLHVTIHTLKRKNKTL
ncbi:hypothetical protein PM10SUCC1_29960 [Propionigenium maris DSM 9537]|uniref:Uncharacterized protein n=1 Tax=Propionigenium maris DSM 9537 TaxID=1123000 RepID=A0A9W6LPD9_9FUSO|nr:hypothetical protein [Propionigenium maris]GLI57482.1 hypothetical protein PM10SUCC1_29960 [Propionigenium maris DSM 9537]